MPPALDDEELLMASTVEAVQKRPTPTWRDGKRYMWPAALAVPLLPISAYGDSRATGHDAFWLMPPLVIFLLIPIVDRVLGDDGGNPPESLVAALQQDRYYRWMTYLYLPLHFVGLVLACDAFTRPDITWLGRIGIILSIGSVSGIAINTAHELGHKREENERWLSRLALAPTFYGHFYVEHNRGHHIRVATPEDPASARLGEGFWAFWPRTVVGSLVSAWKLERNRLRNRGRRVYGPGNDVLTAWAMSVALFGGLTVAFGWQVLPMLFAQALVGISLLESVNYLEHYGLKRQRAASGRYVKVDPRHSWNSNRLATNMFLYQLQRHSDHHANPTTRYQALRHFDESPQLPAGYATMIVVSLIPPLWRRIMDHRVVEHYDGDLSLANVHPPKLAELQARFAR